MKNSPLVELDPDIAQVLYREEEIQRVVANIGAAISRDYAGRTPVLVGTLKGVVYFMADLLRAITIPVQVDYISVSSYSAASRERGLVRLIKDMDLPITGRHVLFVEDVIDTGLTLNYILRNLRLRQPASLEVCALFNKPQHRLIEPRIKYKGFDLPDRLVVGYGLDYREKYRHLPYVGILKPHVFQGSSTAGRTMGLP